MKPAITVIMPVYDVERYVARAIESVLEQSFADFELIIVDDGSPDDSAKIVMQYALVDSRIQFIRQQNAGAPAARNRALKIAQGKYVCFMDSDDWVEKDMLGDMYAMAEAHALEEVIAGFYIDTYYDEMRYVSACVGQPTQVFASQKEFRQNAYRLFDCNMLYPPWNKLFLTEYLRKNQIEFPDTFWDDFPFNLQVIRGVERVGVLEGRYYHFIRARAQSETARYRHNMYEKREEEHVWMKELYAAWGIADEQSTEMVYRRYIERVLGCVENLASAQCHLGLREKIRTVRKMIATSEVRRALKLSRPRSLMMKVMLLPVHLRCAALTYLEGYVIARVRSSNVRIYALLKASR